MNDMLSQNLMVEATRLTRAGRLTEATMRRLNRRVEVDNEPIARVAASAASRWRSTVPTAQPA